jgi:hypothetical protein
MTPDEATMTGTFKMKLPPDLLDAIEDQPLQSQAADLNVGSMKPTLVERMIGLFSRKSAKRS